jgi:hypothetical protein
MQEREGNEVWPIVEVIGRLDSYSAVKRLTLVERTV